MRLIEITSAAFDKKQAEIMGEDNSNNDVLTRCIIDIDRISSFWEDPDDGSLCIHLRSYEESYWTKSYSFDQLKEMLKNDN